MSKKLSWPVAKMREDGTPAIWLTFTHWLIVEPGIVRQYLSEREYEGSYRARQGLRKALGAEWKKHPRLKDQAVVDSGHAFYRKFEACFELWLVGYRAYGHINKEHNYWTPEKLQARGDQSEARAYEEERKALTEVQFPEVAA